MSKSPHSCLCLNQLKVPVFLDTSYLKQMLELVKQCIFDLNDREPIK